MWIFESKYNRSFLAANPKVLTQTLKYQGSISRLYGKRQYVHFILKSMSPTLGPEYIMLVRNPFSRVESYFKEKLRQKVGMALDLKNPYQLKRHQTIFYDFLGIKRTDDLKTQVDGLLKLDFKRFVKLIPEVYALEDHLAPQTYNFSSRRLGLTMKMNRYVHLESKSDMEWLADYFKLDFTHKRNSTDDVDAVIDWDDACISVVQEVYKRDFETFGYDISYGKTSSR